MCLKLFGHGVKNYVRDEYNLFDGMLVVISTVDITLEQMMGAGTGASVITVFRTMRLLRIFKLASKSEGLIVLIEVIKDTIKDCLYFALLLQLFLFVCALIGMDLFAYNIRVNNLEDNFPLPKEKGGVSPRLNFNNI